MIFRSDTSVQIPQIPLYEVLFQNVKDHEEKVALVEAEGGLSYTYKALVAAGRRAGSALSRLGVKKGDIITFYAPNDIKYCVMALGCFSIGAVFSGANYNYTHDEVKHQLSDSKPKVVVTVKGNMDTLSKVMSADDVSVKTVITLDSKVDGASFFDDLMKDDGSAFPEKVKIDVFEDLAAIMYSSGTTGLPKGVMITHFNLVGNITMLLAPGLMPPSGPGEQLVVMLFLPMFHMFGMMVFLCNLSSGGKSAILSCFRPETFLEAIQKHKINTLYLVPPIVLFLAKSPLVEKYDLSSVVSASCAAAPLTKDVEEAFLSRFKIKAITQGYGMTEMTACATSDYYSRKKKPGSSGFLIANTIAKVVDLSSGADLPVGEDGEICLQGPQMLKGYLNRPEATKDLFDEDGWLHTGDVGHFDDEGCLFVTGRIKELIKHKGFQVAPAEVEGVIMRHPGVLDAAVIGVPDEAAGELPRAFVVKRPDKEVTEEDISKHVKNSLSRHKWLTGGVAFVKSIPKTVSGKILRKEVKAMLNEKKD